MSEAKGSTQESSSGSAAFVVVMIMATIGLPLLYCLSLGPAIWLIENTGMDATPFEVIYGPLEWLYDTFEVLQPPLDWYVELWR